MRPEEKIEKKFVEECKNIGITSIKLQVVGDKGWPDQMVIMPKGLIIFFEFKRPNGGELSQHQIKKIEKLKELNHKVYVVDSVEEPLNLVKYALEYNNAK